MIWHALSRLWVALVLAGCSGVHVLDTDAARVDDAGAPTRACRVASPAPTPAFAGEGCYCDGPFVVRGALAYRQSYALEVIDVSVPGAPHLVGSVSSHAYVAADVVVEGDVLFVAGGALERFDLSDPRAPVSLGTLEVGGSVEAMALEAQRLVVSITREDETHALVVLDVSDPHMPVVGGSVELGALGASSIVMRGDTVFAAAMDNGGTGAPARIVAADVGVVTSPRSVGELDAHITFLATLAVHDTRLFLGGLGTGISAIDVSDPAAMRDLGILIEAAPGQQAVVVAGDVLVVSGAGYSLYDLATQGLASLGHTEPTADGPHAAIAGAQLLGSGGSALFSIQLDCP